MTKKNKNKKEPQISDKYARWLREQSPEAFTKKPVVAKQGDKLIKVDLRLSTYTKLSDLATLRGVDIDTLIVMAMQSRTVELGETFYDEDCNEYLTQIINKDNDIIAVAFGATPEISKMRAKKLIIPNLINEY